jgi:hypothetical protein
MSTTFLSTLIQNPSKAIDQICAAIGTEEEEESMDLLTLLLDRQYIPLIADMMKLPALTGDSLLAMANLLGSDSRPMFEAANQALLPHKKRIFEILRSSVATNGVVDNRSAYLLYNWIRLFHHDDVDLGFVEIVGEGLLQFCDKGSTTITDLLYSARTVFDRTPATRAAVMELFRQVGDHCNDYRIFLGTKSMSLLLDAIGGATTTQIKWQQNDFDYVFGVIDRLLAVLDTSQKYKALFALANLVVDKGGADAFFNDSVLLGRVIAVAETGTNKARTEAIWVLANAVQKAADHEIFLLMDNEIYAALIGAVDMEGSAGTVAREAVAVLDRICADYSSMPPLEEDEVTLATDTPVTSAYDLLMGSPVHSSRTVRDLVAALQVVGPRESVPVPANAIFTLADLTDIERLGYIISRGYFYVNPFLLSINL